MTQIILENLGKELLKLPTEYRSPIIAGGAIRDIYFGMTPRDYDVFIDTRGMDKETAEDYLLYLASKFNKCQDRIPILLGDETYKNSDNSILAYQLPKAIPEDISVQFISHVGKSLEDPLKFATDNFDYSLVKCIYDPSTEFMQLSQPFIKSRSSRIIEVDNARTEERVRHWISRYHSEIGDYISWTIADTTPEDKKKTYPQFYCNESSLITFQVNRGTNHQMTLYLENQEEIDAGIISLETCKKLYDRYARPDIKPLEGPPKELDLDGFIPIEEHPGYCIRYDGVPI